MQMMRNPNAMREAMRHQDMAISQLENHPEGFNALRRMYEDVQVSLLSLSLSLSFSLPLSLFLSTKVLYFGLT